MSDDDEQMPSTSRQAAKSSKKSTNDPSIRGKIHSVRVVDFVTYDSVLFTPGRYLNIVIGPNGTGKSTLVAAIILGMGGSPKVLSRSTNIQDYVKNGKETAQIYIKLYNRNAKDFITFGRSFDINGRNQWEIDGRQVIQKIFLQTIADFNIQIDNLCQFLPQDRVQDFTKMNPQELLDNTQSSVCSPDIAEALKNLKDLRGKQKNSSKKLEDNIKLLSEQEKRNEGLQEQIENIRQKERLDKDLDICNKKMAWMKFEELFIKYRETEDDLKKAKENEKRCEDNMRPLVERIKQIDRLKNEYETTINQKATESTKAQSELEKLHDQTDVLHGKLREAKADLDAIKQSAEERDAEIQQSEQVQIALCRDVKDAIELAGSEAEKQKQLLAIESKQNEYKAKNMEYLEKRRTLNKMLDEKLKPQLVATTQRIQSMENIAAMKLEVLRSKYDHAFRGVLWLRNNLQMFSGKVYEPMILELNVKDSSHAKYFENVIATRDLIAFTCERKEDVSLLGRKLRNEQHLNVNIVHSEAADSVLYRPQIPIEHLKKFGCHSYMIDLIEGPPPILNILCRLNRIHMVPIGNQQTYDMSEQMPKEISLFFSTNHRIVVSTSKYTGERSSMCNEINGRQLLSIGVDTAKLEEHKEALKSIVKNTDRCKNERTRLEDEMRKIEEKNTDLSAERQRIIVKFNSVDTCKEKLKRHLSKLNTLKKTVIDVNEATEKFQEKSKKIFEQILRSSQTKILAYEKYANAKFLHEFHREKFRIFKRNNIDMENQIREIRETIETAKSYVTKINKVLDNYKIKCKEKQAEAARLTNGKKPSDGKNFPYRTQFDALPAAVEDLVAYMQELQGRIDCMGVENNNIIEEFEQRKAQIEDLKKMIANSANDTSRLENDMEQIHNKWHSSISETVAVINNYFGTFMTSMGFSGEVELVHSDNIRDYDEYGIQIRVKYRNEEKLQQLDRFIQSGGERAVAIAVYTLSLQHISHVPFRCVDEINQGMDPRNERKIFEMLVDQTSQQGKSQYFFITPKLLPNLRYNKLIAVHIVHNGKFISNPEMFQF